MSDLHWTETPPSGRPPLDGPPVSKTVDDPLGTLILERERPPDDHVDELLLMWRGAQREAASAYAMWSEHATRGGYATYVAALDREERAAEVYANVRGRMIAWTA